MTEKDFFYNAKLPHFDEGKICIIPQNITNVLVLFNYLSKGLSFPPYFGKNWDALDECLRDFHWLEPCIVRIIHIDIPNINESDLITYIDILQYCVNDWKMDEPFSLEVYFPLSTKEKIKSILQKVTQLRSSGPVSSGDRS